MNWGGAVGANLDGILCPVQCVIAMFHIYFCVITVYNHRNGTSELLKYTTVFNVLTMRMITM